MRDPPPPMDSDLVAGTLIAQKYRIEQKLGAGGMGAVYAAKHEALGVRVALKVVLPEIAKDGPVVARFLQEARAAARIEGEHIARVTDVGTLDSGAPFMVMELLEGEDLGAMVDRTGALDPSLAVTYVIQALAGLSEAHALGVVHRDLKPSNLFIVRRTGKPDRVKVLDFGISKSNFEQTGSQITATGSMLGSPAYMSPEQLRSSKSVDARADIWSVGIILYELLTGTLPFHGETVGAVFAAILETEPESPRARRPTVPEGLGEIVLRCLRRKPDERFHTAEELAMALAPFASASTSVAIGATISDPSIRAIPPASIAVTAVAPSSPAMVQTQGTWSDRAATSPKRKPWPLVAAGGAVVIVACAIAAKLLFFSPRPPVQVVSSPPPPPTTAAIITAPAPAPSPSPSQQLAVTSVAVSATNTAAPRAPAASANKIAHPKPSASVQSDDSLFLRH